MLVGLRILSAFKPEPVRPLGSVLWVQVVPSQCRMRGWMGLVAPDQPTAQTLLLLTAATARKPPLKAGRAMVCQVWSWANSTSGVEVCNPWPVQPTAHAWWELVGL